MTPEVATRLLPAHKLPVHAGRDLVPVSRVTAHVSASIASAPVLMESCHTGYKFGVGPLGEPHVPKFLPPSVRPGFFPSWEVAGEAQRIHTFYRS
jgi:hypothetical protein